MEPNEIIWDIWVVGELLDRNLVAARLVTQADRKGV